MPNDGAGWGVNGGITAMATVASMCSAKMGARANRVHSPPFDGRSARCDERAAGAQFPHECAHRFALTENAVPVGSVSYKQSCIFLEISARCCAPAYIM